MPEIAPEFCLTTLIRYAESKGSATGFFFNHKGKTYVITNQHVVDSDHEDGPSSDITDAAVFLRDTPNIDRTNRYDIVISGNDTNWITHPNPTVDVAAIPIQPRLSSINSDSKQSGSLALEECNLLHENIEVSQDISIYGYPAGFVDANTYFPIKRRAEIASPYRAPFDGDPYFVTDAKMQDGTSGSPVLMGKSTGFQMLETKGDIPEEYMQGPHLLGIHSATFYRETVSSEADDEEDLPRPHRYELNVAWYPQLILETIEQAES